MNLLKDKLARSGLGQVVVSTVDSSQGCEAEVVIISFVRGGSNHVGFLADDRRLNVALTRAKYQLILVGDSIGMSRTAKKSGTLSALAIDARDRKCVQHLQGKKPNHKKKRHYKGRERPRKKSRKER